MRQAAFVVGAAVGQGSANMQQADVSTTTTVTTCVTLLSPKRLLVRWQCDRMN
jgi:hypothetical protein